MSDYNRIGIAVIPTMYDVGHDDQQAIGIHYLDVMKGLCPENAASAALDAFHENVSIETLDDFEFKVFDPMTGRVIPENPDHEGYSLSGVCVYSHQATETVPVVYETIDLQGVGT